MLRKDFVSNSSSCSFILYIQSEEDIKQLSKPDVLKILKKHAGVIDKDFHNVPYGGVVRFNDINDLEIGDYIYIYNGEDNEYHFLYNDPEIELSNIDMIYKICQLMNVNPLEHIQYIKDPRGYAHDYRYSLSYKETLLSFGKDCLDFDLDNMLQLTIDFYKNNKNKEMWI